MNRGLRSLLREPWLGLVIALGLALGLFAWEATSGPRFLVDDAFITFTYSKNVARGLGPVYGHGLHVEGYSNFLWMLIVALPLAFSRHADPLAVSYAVGAPFVALLLGSTYLLVRARARAVPALVATLLLAANLDVVLAYLSGLETVPYVALLTAGFAALAWSDRSPLARRLAIPCFTAVALTRIDGFIPLGFAIGFDALVATAERRFSFRPWFRWALPGVLVWAAWFGWRWAYYGLPLPTTVYAKALIPEKLPMRGITYVYDELRTNRLYLAIPAFGFLLYRRHQVALMVGLFAALQLVQAERVGGDWMPCARFVLPAVPLLVAILAFSHEELAKELADRNVVFRVANAAFFLGVAAFVLLGVEHHLTEAPHQKNKLGLAADQTAHVERLKKAVRFLAEVVPVKGRLVTDYGGVVAYYTEANPIEMWGLCNADIATKGNTENVAPVYGRTCPACYVKLDPEYFHVMTPLVRRADSFAHHRDVVRNVWQTDTIGRYLDFDRDFVSGRIRRPSSSEALWFLEKKTNGALPKPRRTESGYDVEYPFSPGGLLQ